MTTITYYLIMSVVTFVRCLPLVWVAHLGRALGGVFYYLDGRHRRRALANLEKVFGDEWERGKIVTMAKENFRRLGENYACAIKAAYMSDDALRSHIEVRGAEHLIDPEDPNQERNRVFAIGHFGNFELYARLGHFLNFKKPATTYRALKNPAANRVMEEMRSQSRLTYYERKRDVQALKNSLREGGLSLGILCDHHAGGGGLPSRCLGHLCSATPAPAVLALRYRAKLYSAFVFRTSLAHWAIEVRPEIPLRNENGARSISELTQEVQNVIGEAILQDPANWFWVHNRWRTKGRAFARSEESESSNDPKP